MSFHVIWTHILELAIDLHQVGQLRSLSMLNHLWHAYNHLRYSFIGICFSLLDLLLDCIMLISHVDPAHVIGVRLRHLLSCVSQTHHPRHRSSLFI
jgi:hypothetical protein